MFPVIVVFNNTCLHILLQDISKFGVIFMIVLLAFFVGLNNLYWYYEPGVRAIVEMDTHEKVITNAEQAFGK